jgi:hypothetical protein
MKKLKRVGGQWYLVTGRGRSRAVRDIAREQLVTGPDADALFAAPAEREMAATDVWAPDDERPGSEIPVIELGVWKAIAAAVDQGLYDRAIQEVERRIPITPLRDVCTMLRLLTMKDVPERLAQEWTRAPSSLARLFGRSVADFDTYENDESFLPAVRTGNTVAGDDLAFARRIVKHAEMRGLDVGGRHLTFVEYEVSPRRTTRAGYEGDEPGAPTGKSSGAGGIDLLLAGADSVVICEVKARTDVPLLVGLVQCLMYAAELTSAAQRRRLARHFPPLTFLGAVAEREPVIELLLLYERDGNYSRESEALRQLVTGLLAGEALHARMMRRHIRGVTLAHAGADLAAAVDWSVP